MAERGMNAPNFALRGNSFKVKTFLYIQDRGLIHPTLYSVLHSVFLLNATVKIEWSTEFGGTSPLVHIFIYKIVRLHILTPPLKQSKNILLISYNFSQFRCMNKGNFTIILSIKLIWQLIKINIYLFSLFRKINSYIYFF